MKSRVALCAALLVAFVVGLICVRPVAKAMETFGATTCATVAPCLSASNTNAGIGVQGTSANGNGLVGITSFQSKSASNYKSGVVGIDRSTSGSFDAGVLGTSANGSGVYGVSTTNNLGQFGAGVKGLANTGIGVQGTSGNVGVQGIGIGGAATTGVYGIGSGGGSTGVHGAATTGNGVTGSTSSGSGVEGTSSSGNGVTGSTNSGTGVVGTSSSGNGVTGATSSAIGVKGVTSGTNTHAVALVASSSGGGDGLLFAGDGKGGQVAELDTQGNWTISGTITTSGSCSKGCVRRREGSYGETAAEPTISDNGEATLRYGAAFVQLDPNFANAIDSYRGYFVLITPEMDTRGLYVAQRTASGFTVRENMGGRSSGTFAYRIVAHPYGNHAPRLPYLVQK